MKRKLGRARKWPRGMWLRMMPVEDKASCLPLESCNMSPKAVISIGPFIPLALIAAAMEWATLKTLIPEGTLQFSKSHHTETFTFRDSSSCRLENEWDWYWDWDEEAEKWDTWRRRQKGREHEDEEDSRKGSLGERCLMVRIGFWCGKWEMWNGFSRFCHGSGRV